MPCIGDIVKIDVLIKMAGVKNEYGLQSGILVNDNDKLSILKMEQKNDSINVNYPNYWDEQTIGILHYCGTDKGLTKKSPDQNLNSKLNNAIFTGKYPIHVFVKQEGKLFLYLGVFERIPAMDVKLEYKNHMIYQFALVSRNIDAVEPYISKILN